ncbi:elongation of very long chain fatty acids protein 4-like [Physella acuta]|uniref:elongation of very long chain fatty acids protein 4-like n=1 Tax=Physella acuta TaxID=109671 RepID=UPI0027DC1EFD|nr:elongation of very long chain fatty acids protein 4-like [Physella acuta]
MEAIVAAVNIRFNLTPSNIVNGDPRVSEWFLMNNLASVLTIILLYLLMVKHGPAFMEKRPPFQLSQLLVVYNFALVILSAYIFFEMFAVGVIRGYNLFCQPVNYENTAIGLREASVSWWYFISKIVELLDTAFFILRKKNGQVTFLHVYHHSTMTVLCWYAAKYVPGGEKFYNGGFNSLIHVFMYTYYGLAAMGPQVQKYLWWKRYLTEFQLVQFLGVNARSIFSFFSGPCEYPTWINVVALLYSSSLLLLFLNFYLKTYKSKASKSN